MKKLSQLNRLMAISRHPEYIKDFKKYSSLLLSKDLEIIEDLTLAKLRFLYSRISTRKSIEFDPEDGNSGPDLLDIYQNLLDIYKMSIDIKFTRIEPERKALENKLLIEWQLEAPIPIYCGSNILTSTGTFARERAAFTVEEISDKYPPLHFVKKNPGQVIVTRQANWTLKEWLNFKKEYYTIKGKYLYLRIDITRNEDDIINETKWAVNYHKSFIPPLRGQKPTEYDPWVVYDMHILNKLTYAEISRRLPGQSESKTDNLSNASKRATRAYEAAERMIVMVGKERNLIAKRPLA